MQDELDILREVGSIAAAHGSIALSEILGRKINLTMPSLDFVSLGGTSTKIDLERSGIAVIVRGLTGLKGQSAFVLDEKNAFKLIDLSYRIGQDDKKMGILTEVGISTLKEIGNIVISAYLNAVGMILKRVILSLPPTLISGTLDEIFNIILSASESGDFAFLIEAIFEEPQDKIRGGFYLVLTPEAACDIRETCKRMLANLGKDTV